MNEIILAYIGVGLMLGLSGIGSDGAVSLLIVMKNILEAELK